MTAEERSVSSSPQIGRIEFAPDYESAQKFATQAHSLAGRERLLKAHLAMQREDWEYKQWGSVGGVYLTPAQARNVREFLDRCTDMNDGLFSLHHGLYDDAYSLLGLFPANGGQR